MNSPAAPSHSLDMFVYHRTNGENGEILVEMFGNFLGFIVNLGRPDRWAAYTRQMEPIGEGYGSEAQAATACLHDCVGKPKIRMGDILPAAVG